MASKNIPGQSVITNLLKRQNKTVPVKDGRKIILVTFGGTMLGIRGGATMIALTEMGFQNAFDEIYTISAGFANASYLMTGQAALGTSIYWEDCSGKKFINFLKPWNVANITYVIKVIDSVKKLAIEKLYRSQTKLFVRLVEVKNKKMTYLEVHDVPKNEYLGLMRAAISLPYLQPGHPTVGGVKYKDPGLRKNDLIEHMEKAFQSGATDIVVVYNYYGQYEEVNRKWPDMPENVLQIVPKPDWEMKVLETRRDVLRMEALRMGKMVKEMFGMNGEISLAYDRN